MLYGKKPSAEYLQEHQIESEAFLKEDTTAAKKIKGDDDVNDDEEEEEGKSLTFMGKVRGLFQELIKIYGPRNLRNQALICHFTWCITSLTYYMLSLNAENFRANIYVWTGLTGTVDIFGYIVSIFVLKWSTRRLSQFTLFVLAGIFLLAVLGVSKDKEIVLLVLAMMSRFSITSVYAIMTLHTAEMFPTEIRNSVLGISSTAAHFGSFFAPYIGICL
jgi:Sugar (and other) transporter